MALRSLGSNIKGRIRFFTTGNYTISNTWVIPTAEQLGVGKQGRLIETAILFADMRKSSNITEDHRRQTVAKVYQSFHSAMALVARSDGGQIRAYDGDRIMVVFTPERRNSNAAANKAVTTAMKISWCLHNILKPQLGGYDSIDCGIGVAFGRILVVKAGIGGAAYNQDLVWVGRPTNLAAKLSEAGSVLKNNIWIDEETYNRLDDNLKQAPKTPGFGYFGQSVWNPEWVSFSGQQMRVYSSNYTLPFR